MKIIDFRCRAPFSHYPEAFHNARSQDLIRRFKIGPSSRMSTAKFFDDPRLEVMFQEMEEAEVVKAVIPCRAIRNIDNEAAMQLMEKYPDKLHVMPGVDGDKVEEALTIIDKYCINDNAKGITIEPGFCSPALYADDQKLAPIYQKCADNGLIVFISFGALTSKSIAYNEPSIMSRVALQFPNAKFVLAHGGYPYTKETCYLAFQHKNVYVLPDFYFLNVPGGSDYRDAISFIPDQLIFGSGAPIANIQKMKDYYLACGALQEDLQKVMYSNAAKLLGMEESAN